MKCCQDCAYAQAIEGRADGVECRLNPPAMILLGMQQGVDLANRQIQKPILQPVITLVLVSHWCGQFRPHQNALNS